MSEEKKDIIIEEEVKEKNDGVDAVSALLDRDNNENIFLHNENDEEIEFEQVAIIPLNNLVYAILKPVGDFENVAEDEGVVFLLSTNENDRVDYLVRVEDEDVIDEVFSLYYKLFDDEEEEI